MRHAIKILLSIITGILVINIVSALAILNQENIKTSYAPLENISGIINLTLQQIPSSSLLESSLGGKISMKEFLDKNNAPYSCIPKDCGTSYLLSQPSQTKTLSLQPDQEIILGINIEGKMREGNSIRNFALHLTTNSQPSCTPPLTIDILNDKNPDYTPNESLNDFSCYETRGCFSSSTGEVKIIDADYCEKITLPPAPAFSVGAVLKKEGEKTEILIKLLSKEGNELASCTLPDATSQWSEISCFLSYHNKKIQDFSLCIRAAKESSYLLQYEDQQPLCGYYESPQENSTVDYHLFAKAAKYKEVRDITLNQSLNKEIDLLSLLSEYITSRYQDDCSQGCILPLVIKAGTEQTISLNQKTEYATLIGPRTTQETYNTEKKDAEISLQNQTLNLLPAGFQTPETYGNFTLIISLKNTLLLNKTITIERVPTITSLTPQSAPQSVKTRFHVLVVSPENKPIISYLWEFGDNSTQETQISEVYHTYTKTGIYNLKITVKDESEKSGSTSFPILIGSAKDAVNETLRELKRRLSEINLLLSPKWYKKSIEDEIHLLEIEKQVRELDRSFLAAKIDLDYSNIAQRLSDISLPKQIYESPSTSIPFLFKEEKIDFSSLEQLGAGSVFDEETVRESVKTWLKKKNLQKSYKILVAEYDNEAVPIATLFTITIQPKEKIFFIINKRQPNLQFNNLQSTDLGSATGIETGGSLVFLSKSSENPEDLLIYAVPLFETILPSETCNENKICEEKKGETSRNCADCRKKISLWIFLLFFLMLIIILTVYIIHKKKSGNPAPYPASPVQYPIP